MAHRPFTPRHLRENAAFLAALRRTGNARPADPAEAFAALERTLDADARVRHYEATGQWHLPGEPELPELPPLGLVTGWSKAAAVKVAWNPGVPLFGGWRLDDWRKSRKAG